MGSVSKNTMYRYNFQCLTEGKNYQLWDLPTNVPTSCPVNDGHIIDRSNIEIIKKNYDTYLDIPQSRTVEQDDQDATQEYFRVENFNFACPSNSITRFPIMFKYPIAVLSVKVITKTYNDLDIFDNYTSVPGPVGYITSNVDIGATSIKVNPTVIQYITRGLLVTLTDGVNSESLGECIKIYNDRIITEMPTVNSYSSNAPTYIKIKAHNIKNLILHKEVPFLLLGESKVGGSIIPVGLENYVYYNNLSSNVDKDINFTIEYMY